MKNIWKLLGTLAVLGAVIEFGHAAQTCNRADMYCYESGPTANLSTVGRLDSSGNLSTLGNTTIGSVSGASVAGTGNLTYGGQTVWTPPSITVTSSSIVSLSGTFDRLVSTGGPEVIIGLSTTGVSDGQFVVIAATADVNAVTITSGTSSGTGVGLGAATRVIDSKGKLGLIFDAFGSIWREVFYSAN